jgi:hypothetical protein
MTSSPTSPSDAAAASYPANALVCRAGRNEVVTATACCVNVGVKLARGPRGRRRLEVPVDDLGDRFLALVHELDDVASSVTVQRALAEFDDTTLQVFWKKWPHVSAWTGRLWSTLSADLALPPAGHDDPDHDETGGSG